MSRKSNKDNDVIVNPAQSVLGEGEITSLGGSAKIVKGLKANAAVTNQEHSDGSNTTSFATGFDGKVMGGAFSYALKTDTLGNTLSEKTEVKVNYGALQGRYSHKQTHE